jgi:hypothetical protein
MSLPDEKVEEKKRKTVSVAMVVHKNEVQRSGKNSSWTTTNR